MAKTNQADFSVQNEGSICILHLHSQAAKDWAEEYVGDAETQTWCGGIVVEPRYIENIVVGMLDAGFLIQE